MAENNPAGDGRKGILPLIDSSTKLAALIVLVVEAVLGILLTKAKPEDTILYVSMMVGILLVTIIMAFIIEYKKVNMKGSIAVPAIGTSESQKKNFDWDVFLAAPMASIETDEELKNSMLKVEELMKVIEDECDLKRIFFAGKGMRTKKDFDDASLSVKEDMETIKNSRIFILVYPEKIVSSVLYEAGIAIGFGKPSFYFGDPNKFPFLMKEANNAFKHVKIHAANSIDDVIAKVKINKAKMFSIDT